MLNEARVGWHGEPCRVDARGPHPAAGRVRRPRTAPGGRAGTASPAAVSARGRHPAHRRTCRHPANKAGHRPRRIRGKVLLFRLAERRIDLDAKTAQHCCPGLGLLQWEGDR